MKRNRLSSAPVVCLLLLPATANAEWLFTPSIGTTFGADTHGRSHPILGAAVGLIQMRVVTADGEEGLFDSLVHEFGWNVGAGALGFVGGRVGIRGDVRYLRSFQNQRPSWTRGLDADIAPGNFDFWRAGVGVTLRWGE